MRESHRGRSKTGDQPRDHEYYLASSNSVFHRLNLRVVLDRRRPVKNLVSRVEVRTHRLQPDRRFERRPLAMPHLVSDMQEDEHGKQTFDDCCDGRLRNHNDGGEARQAAPFGSSATDFGSAAAELWV